MLEEKYFCNETKLIISGVLIVFLLTATVYLIFGIKAKIGESIGENTITVSDSGEIYAEPDLAVIDLSVISEAATVTEAMNQNTGKMDTIVARIKGLNVDADDLKTTNFNIYPRYEYIDERRTLAGYEVHQTLNVKIRELQKASSIIQTATNAGVNQVGNLQFTIDEQDSLKEQAREMAIEKAKAKAKELAKQLGVKLVKISGFNEGYDSVAPTVYREAAYGIGGGGPSSIEPGQNKIEVTVSITYEIN
jgi:uncharacterized protein YggE